MRNHPRGTHLASPLASLAFPLVALLAGCGGNSSGGGTPACGAAPQTVEAPASGGWKLISPADWGSSCALDVHAAGLAADERLALVLVNAGGADKAVATLTASGTGALAVPAPGQTALALAGEATAAQPDLGRVTSLQRDSLERWLTGQGAREAELRRLSPAAPAAPQALAIGDHRTFCVDKLLATTSYQARPATLQAITAHALFYMDDAVFTNFQTFVLPARPDFWTALGNSYESAIAPMLDTYFGAVTDIDANAQIIFLLTNLSVPGTSGSFVAGFFNPNDMQTADSTAACTGNGSNHADMLYLMDPYTYGQKSGLTYDDIVGYELPGTMSHELQHDVLFNTRCLANHLPSCAASSAGDLWMNEGLSMTAEDLAGFGLNGKAERERVGNYLSCLTTGGTDVTTLPAGSPTKYTCSRNASLTSWPSTGGDPFGNYGGVHAFLRWHLDQKAKVGGAALSTFTKGLVGSTQGAKAAVAAGSGLSFEEGYARFATAALFSGETFDPSPATAYGAGAWSPLHATVADPTWTKLQPGLTGTPLTLRTDGWAAVQTGLGSGADATVEVATSAAVRPRVAVIRFKGTLAAPANTAP